jgi:phosphoglycolate phosphatase-like HAD superfamily hydrolase
MRALLWDLDDTLLQTLPARMSALEFAYETCLGSKTDGVALWRSHRGGTLEDLARRLVGHDYLRFVTAYRDHYYGRERDIQPFAGIEAVLKACLEVELPMAVVTSKVAWGATEELLQVDLLRYFQAVVGFDDTELHKPDPEPVYVAMERLLEDDASQVMFVGDTPADIWAARNAGCKSVGALWGTIDEEQLLDAIPDFTIRQPGELLAILSGEVVSG